MRQITLITISGDHKPGLTSRIVQAISQHDSTILDIGQSVIHKTISLGLLIELPDSNEHSAVFRDIQAAAGELGVNVKISPVELDSYEGWVNGQGKQRRIITALGRRLTTEQLEMISRAVSENGLTIDGITRLTGRISLANPPELPRACIEFSVRGEQEQFKGLRVKIMNIAQETGIDIAYQVDNIYRRSRRLVAFDMDSTLIQAEVIDELAREHGVYEQVAAITEAALRGEIDFRESLLKRVSLLEGLDEGALKRVAERLPLTDGVVRLVRILKDIGFKLVIISGGFTYFGRYLQKHLGFDYVFANELEIENGVLTGKLVGDIVDSDKKAELLETIVGCEGLKLEQTVAVGDGANDLPMLRKAGLGIAFHAKPVVREGAKQAISSFGLDGILYLMGVRDREADFE